MPALASLLLLLSTTAPGAAPVEPVRLRAGVELSALGLPVASGPYLSVLPLVSYDGGEPFGVELGGALRLSASGLRREDWDSVSDFGQLLRELRAGAEGGPLWLRAGTLSPLTLGTGRLVRRYDGTLNPDYHPAGAVVAGRAGTLGGELLASDVLGARLFAGEVRWDAGRELGLGADRLSLALSAAHDAGLAGARAPSATLAALEGMGVVARGAGVSLGALGSAGLRLGVPGWGAAAGLLLDAAPGGHGLSVQLEGRWQADGFRHGYFGPDYELRRFSGVGLSGQPLAEERLAPGLSVAATAQWQLPRTAGGEPPLALVLSAERFSHGRWDADGALSWLLSGGAHAVALRGGVTGLGLPGLERPWVLAEGRARVAPAVYVVGSGGTVFFPEPAGGAEGSTRLRPGVQASIGVGLDLAR
jgi:hypothetical protein